MDTSKPQRQAYPSDVTDAEWEILSAFIPEPASGGRPAQYSRREIVNGIFYILRTGCGWAYLPHDLPPWKTVYYYFRQWRKAGIWEQANFELSELSRIHEGRAMSPSLGIVDTQSVQTTEKGGLGDSTITRK